MIRKRDSKETMMETLFSAFANPSLHDVQSNEVFWAIEEGMHRVSDLHTSYTVRNANKQHECVRDCQIKRGERYFVSTYDWGGIKMCASCMAMIVYFLNVWESLPYHYDYWDDEKKHPHIAENGLLTKTLRDILLKP